MDIRRKNVFIQCDGFYLRGLESTDLAGHWYDWFNDSEITRFQNKGYIPNTLQAQTSYFEALQKSDHDVVFAIIDDVSDSHVGNVGLHGIDRLHRTAMLGIVIGEREYMGRGWGKQAWVAITKYAFEVINLHKVSATVFDGNDRSLKCALAAGYEVEGCQKEQMYKNGKYCDLIWLGITRDRWIKSCLSGCHTQVGINA